jgi:riboflavin kinase / FMN adenylyltransferase
LGKLGVDYVVTHPFDAVLRQMRAADFDNLMVKHLKLNVLWVGSDFALGYKREGNVEFLRKDGEQKGFSVHVMDLVQSGEDHTAISSTAIRQALQQGDVEKAREWLGRAYTVAGPVVRGDQRGRTIGFPTANIDMWAEQVIPANGIYAGWATLGSERFMAMTNVGVRPTFNGQNITVEAYLLDFDRDIYGQKLALSFEKRLRPEERFNGVDALVAQIKKDVEAGREYLTKRPFDLVDQSSSLGSA